jgi:hypothetical protein
MRDSWWTKGRWNRSIFRILLFCLIDISPPMVYTHRHLHTTLTTTWEYSNKTCSIIYRKSIVENGTVTQFLFFSLRTSKLTSRVALLCKFNWNRKVEHMIIKKSSNELISAYFGYSIWCCNKDKGRPNMPWRDRRVVEVYLSLLTSAVDGSRWSTPRSVRFTTLQENLYPFYGRLGGPRSRSG